MPFYGVLLTALHHSAPSLACQGLSAGRQLRGRADVHVNTTHNPKPLPACQGLRAERQLRGRADVHLLAYPNAGEAWDAGARAWRPGTGLEAGAFGAAAAGWADAGATLIGGEGPSIPH